MKFIYKVFYFVLFCTPLITAQQTLQTLSKTLYDDSRFTNSGNIGLSVTNFGMHGSGWVGWPNVPSCEYPLGSGIEHLFAGGLWVGGFKKDSINSNIKSGPFVS
ncbi:MAG TPA: hypothetical protein PK195_10195, partial [Ignavibacteriaceae bacterium]|nr:hypothetical protein [Ignavibacteriaceae bacterium]